MTQVSKQHKIITFPLRKGNSVAQPVGLGIDSSVQSNALADARHGLYRRCRVAEDSHLPRRDLHHLGHIEEVEDVDVVDVFLGRHACRHRL
jgi:hypothetical protein